MTVVKTGDTVQVHYTGTLIDGTVFDSSREREPMEFKVGEGQLLPDFEYAVIGMKPGERKTISIPCEGAYGEHDADMDLIVPRDSIPEEIAVEVGAVLNAKGPEGENATFRVVGIQEDQVIMDGNHPLAGHDLTFELELVKIC